MILTFHVLNDERHSFYLLLISSFIPLSRYSKHPALSSASHASPPLTAFTYFTEEINASHVNFLNLPPNLQSYIHFHSTFLPSLHFPIDFFGAWFYQLPLSAV